MGNSRSIVTACCAAVFCQTAAWALGPVAPPAIDPDAGLPVVARLEAGALVAASPPQSVELAGSGECEEIGGLDRQFLATNRLRGNWYDFEVRGVLTEIRVFLELSEDTELTFFVYKERPVEPNVFDLLWTDVMSAQEEPDGRFYASPPVNGGKLQMEMDTSYVIGVGWGATSVIFGRSDDGVGPFSRGQVRGIVGIDQAPPPPDPEEGWEFNDPFDRGAYFAQLCFAPDPGACCFGNVCEDGLNAGECLGDGGQFAGPNTSCADVTCPLPPGACCVNDRCFPGLTRFQCEGNDDGVFFEGLDCIDDEPCSPRGACCLATGCIEAVTERACIVDLLGIYRGDDVDCNDGPTCNAGACCIGDECFDGLNEQTCPDAGGVYQGPGSDCRDATCAFLGACCYEDKEQKLVCVDAFSVAECEDLSGIYRGDNTECADIECQECGDENPCIQDGEFCNGVEQCIGGLCAPGANPCPGQVCREVPQDCVDCVEDFHCPGGQVCDSDNNVCVDCLVNGDCDDGNPCTTDTCEANACVYANVDDETDCADEEFCNGVEECLDGMCIGEEPCVDLEHCDEEADVCLDCVQDAECSDDVFCNGAELCVDGFCGAGVEPCEDQAHCDEENDVCLECHEDAECSDDVFCNGAELCLDGSCADGEDPCIDMDHCDEQNDTCLECLVDSECSDGVWCNGRETCDVEDNVCVTEITCEKGMMCQEEEQRCGECFVDEDCTGDPGPCREWNCADDFCLSDPDLDQNGDSCEDGLFCTVAETCDAGICAGEDLICPECEMCDEVEDMCVVVEDGTECIQDGVFCNGAEICLGGVCSDGEEPECPECQLCDLDEDECVPGCCRDPDWDCDGDVDGDGQVNPVDSGLVQASFGSTDEQDLCNYDVDCDGQINPVDSGIVQSLFGTCNRPRYVCP